MGRSRSIISIDSIPARIGEAFRDLVCKRRVIQPLFFISPATLDEEVVRAEIELPSAQTWSSSTY